jgi:hypothetical protein
MFGSGDALKSKAFDLIYDAARNMEAVPRRGASVAVDWNTIGLKLPQAG